MAFEKRDAGKEGDGGLELLMCSGWQWLWEGREQDGGRAGVKGTCRPGSCQDPKHILKSAGGNVVKVIMNKELTVI